MIEHYKDTSFSNNIESIRNDNNIKFLQHNCMKLINVMQSCLKYATINKYDIVLLQEGGDTTEGICMFPSASYISGRSANI